DPGALAASAHGGPSVLSGHPGGGADRTRRPGATAGPVGAAGGDRGHRHGGAGKYWADDRAAVRTAESGGAAGSGGGECGGGGVLGRGGGRRSSWRCGGGGRAVRRTGATAALAAAGVGSRMGGGDGCCAVSAQ